MSEGAPPVLAPLSSPRSPRRRARLVLLLLLGLVWVLPWFGSESGATYAGAPGALAFAAAWGLAATLSAAGTREGLALGEAATSLAVAAIAAVLAAVDHPWLKGPAGSSSLVPIFVPLALLCALDLLLRVARPGTGREVTALRAGAALLAGASLAAALRWVPAAAALAVGLLPAAARLPLERARRALEIASLAVAVVLLFSREIQEAAAHLPPPVDQPTVWAFCFNLFSVCLGVLAGLGIFGAAEPLASAHAP